MDKYYLDILEEINKTRLKYNQYYRNLGLTPNNAKLMIQELCQKLGNRIPEYELISKSESDHDLRFTVKLIANLSDGSLLETIVLEDRDEWFGTGKNKERAELKAAENLCDDILMDYIPSDKDW